MLDTANTLIVKELAIAQDMSEEDIAQEIEEIFAD